MDEARRLMLKSRNALRQLYMGCFSAFRHPICKKLFAQVITHETHYTITIQQFQKMTLPFIIKTILAIVAIISFIRFIDKFDASSSNLKRVVDLFERRIAELCASIKESIVVQENAAKTAASTNQLLVKYNGKVHYIKDRKTLVQVIENTYLSSDMSLAKRILCHNLHIRYEVSKVEYLNSIKEVRSDIVEEINLLLRIANLYQFTIPAPLENLQSFKNYKKSLAFRPAESDKFNNPAYGKPFVSKPMRDNDNRNPAKKRK